MGTLRTLPFPISGFTGSLTVNVVPQPTIRFHAGECSNHLIFFKQRQVNAYSINNLIYCELFSSHNNMPTVNVKLNSSFSDSGDKIVDVLTDEIHNLRYVEGIIRTLRQEKEAIQRVMILSKNPIK